MNSERRSMAGAPVLEYIITHYKLQRADFWKFLYSVSLEDKAYGSLRRTESSRMRRSKWKLLGTISTSRPLLSHANGAHRHPSRPRTWSNVTGPLQDSIL